MLMACGVAAESGDTVPEDSSVQEMKYCQLPNVDNPLANPLPYDYGDGPKLPACPSDAVGHNIDAEIDKLPITSVIASETGDTRLQRSGRRTFYSLPATTIPQNMENFRNALYGENLTRRVDHGFDANIFS